MATPRKFTYHLTKVPETIRYGTPEHKQVVQRMYRRTMKYLRWNFCFDVRGAYDFHAHYLRIEFDKSKSIKDSGEIVRMLTDLQEALEIFEHERHSEPLDGPGGSMWARYPQWPQSAFRWVPGGYQYSDGWRDESLEEYYLKQEIEKYRYRYITFLRDVMRVQRDYPTFLGIKKRLEEEFEEQVFDLMCTLRKSQHDWWMEYPYNTPNEFSDGSKIDTSLDLAYFIHDDDDLTELVATLTPEERAEVEEKLFGKLVSGTNFYGGDSKTADAKLIEEGKETQRAIAGGSPRAIDK